MTLGPVELVVLGFPGSNFTGDIRPRIIELIEQGIVNVIDALLIRKDSDGHVDMIELQEATDDDEATALSQVLADQLDLLTDDDVDQLAADLAPGSSALVIVFEHLWMRPVRDAVAASGGVLLADYHVPAAVVDEVLAATAST